MAKEFDFYGVCDNHYKLDNKIWEAIEDPGDGYRSYLQSVEETSDYTGIFFPEPLAKVIVVRVNRNYFKGYEIIDVKDNHVWLKIGTDNTDDYYPWFVFDYQPKVPEQNSFYTKIVNKDSWEIFISE
jgi:hypothetical protein